MPVDRGFWSYGASFYVGVLYAAKNLQLLLVPRLRFVVQLPEVLEIPLLGLHRKRHHSRVCYSLSYVLATHYNDCAIMTSKVLRKRITSILLDIENVYMVSHLNLSTLYARSLKHIVACGEVLQISGSSEHQWECGRAAEAGRVGKCCTELLEFKY